ncbi:unnamed protein product, partial [Musa acuminata var. zebrina]
VPRECLFAFSNDADPNKRRIGRKKATVNLPTSIRVTDFWLGLHILLKGSLQARSLKAV